MFSSTTRFAGRLALVIAIVTLVMSGEFRGISSFAQATNSTTISPINFTFVSPNPTITACAGERVQLTFSGFALVHMTFDAHGSTHINTTFVLSLVAVGQETGTTWVGQDVRIDHATYGTPFPQIDSELRNWMMRNTEDPNDIRTFHVLLQYRVNADGTLVLDDASEDLHCS